MVLPDTPEPAASTDAKSTPKLHPDPLIELSARLAKRTPLIDDPARKADLLCRLGLLCWDVLGDLEAAAKYLGEAGHAHPDAVHLRLQLAITRRDEAGLLELQSEVGAELTDRDAAVRFYRSCAETWLFRFGNIEMSIKAAREALRKKADDAETRNVLLLALELTGDAEAIVKHLNGAPGSDLAAQRRLLALLGDTLGNPAATAQCARRLGAVPGAEQDRYLQERLRELVDAGVAEPTDGPTAVATLLGARARLLEGTGAEGELAATRFLLAGALPPAQHTAAAAIYEDLARDDSDWGMTLALQARRALAARIGDRRQLAEVYELLSIRAGDDQLQVVYLVRAGQLFEAEAQLDRAIGAYSRALDVAPGNLDALGSLERIFLSTDRFAELIERYEHGAEHAAAPAQVRWLLRAAQLAEARLDDPAEAARLRRPTIESHTEPTNLANLARIFRAAQDLDSLERTYAQALTILPEEQDPRRRALYATAAGAVALALDRVDDADRYLSEALGLSPDDLFVHTALMGLYRRAEKWRELVTTIERELELGHPPEEQARLHTEIGRIALEHLHDADLAQTNLDRAAALSQDDPSLHHLMARLYDLRGDPQRAIELRRKAADGFGRSYRAAVLLCEIGDIFRGELGDDAQAEAAYREALEVDDEVDGALASLGELHRARGEHAEYAQLLEQRIDLAVDGAAQSALHLELADVASEQLGDLELGIEHYQDAVRADPSSGAALAGLQRAAREHDRWEVLADTLMPIATEATARRVLLEALERLERWQDVAALLDEELAAATLPAEIVTLGNRLAQLHENNLDDGEAALEAIRRAYERAPKDPGLLEQYRRLAEAAGRSADLVDIYRKYLSELPETSDERPGIYERLGGLLLAQPEGRDEAEAIILEAAQRYPKDPAILNNLAKLYAKGGNTTEHLDALLRLADVSAVPGQRVEALLDAGKIYEAEGELDRALKIYLECFRQDPGHREAFTVVERLCYRLKRWREVMEVYDTAIRLVESQGSRAYRLADLYSRRGQLQLQYLSQTGEAAASYLKVLEIDPDSDTSVKFLESIFSKEGDWAGLIHAYEMRADRLDDAGKKVETLRRAARVAAAKLKDAAEAARFYESIRGLAPTDAEALDALERYYERTRAWDKLIRVLATRIAQPLAEEEILALRLRIAHICEEGLRDVDAAIENYREVLELSPNHREALEALARIYEATERWAEFIDATRRQIRITKDRGSKALFYFKCGSVMEAKFGKSDDAIRYYEAAIKTSTNCLPAVHGLRDLYLRKENWKKVLSTLELEVKLWQESKERAGVFARMGKIYEDRLGDAERAVQYYESSLAVDAECMPAIRALFDISFRKNDWHRAAKLSASLSQKALREGEPEVRSDFYHKRGMVAEHTGDHHQAAENYVIALEIRPENLGALDALTALCRRQPQAYDFANTFGALEKVYQRRDWSQAQARVLVARGTLLEQQGRVSDAIGAYRQATELAPDDFSILPPLVDLLVKFRRIDEALRVLEEFAGRLAPDNPAAVDALLTTADILSNVVMDSRRSAAVLRIVLKRDPENRLALYRYAQELVVQGRLDEARGVVDRLIQVAASPENTAPAEELGHYYYYLGHVAQRAGDTKAASSAFRRALDLAPGYPLAAIALANRHRDAGKLIQAETLLSSAAGMALERGKAQDSLALRRQLAAIQADGGNLAGAIAELRAVVATGDAGPDDRLHLAELYLQTPDSRGRALEEVRLVLQERPTHPDALRMMADIYPTSDPVGRVRPLRALRLLGLASPADDAELKQHVPSPLSAAPFTPALRGRFLAGTEIRASLGQLWEAAASQLDHLYPPASLPKDLEPYRAHAGDAPDPREIAASLGHTERPFEIFIAAESPRPLLIERGETARVVLRREALRAGGSAMTFILATALEYLHSGFSLLCRIGPRERTELGRLLKAMAKPPEHRESSANEFMAALSRPQIKAIARVGQAAAEVIPEVDALGWMRAVDVVIAQIALLACDDIEAACHGLAYLHGVSGVVLDGGQVVTAAVPGAEKLLRFYVSTDYYRLRTDMVRLRGSAGL